MLIAYANNTSRIAGPDAALAAIIAADFPAITHRERDANSGELFLEFSNGMALFVHNGERDPHTATYLDLGHNIEGWLNKGKARLMQALLLEARNAVATSDGKLTNHIKGLLDRIERLGKSRY